MITENLKPNKISDIVHRMDEYISAIREAGEDEGRDVANFLLKFITDYFENEKADDLELKKITVEMVDDIYVKIMNLKQRDAYTNIYFGNVLNRLFWELRQNNILAFYIVDNTIRDDRFKMLIELLNSVQFAVVYPYIFDEIKYSENYSKYPTKEYKDIEKQIDEGVKQKKHILYVEKDDSVNYLNNILALGEEFQSKYVCIFRNHSVDDAKGPTWLLGSFADYLETQKLVQ
jgi:hypothetical protein